MRHHRRHYGESPITLRPGALCIAPHLHAAIFEPSIDADVSPRTFRAAVYERPGAAAISTNPSGHAPSMGALPPSPGIHYASSSSSSSSSSLCADRPSPSERRFMSPIDVLPVRARAAIAARPRSPLCPSLTSSLATHRSAVIPEEKQRLMERDEYEHSHEHKYDYGYDSEKAEPATTTTTTRTKWHHRPLFIALAIILAFPLTYFLIGAEIVLLDGWDDPDSPAALRPPAVGGLAVPPLGEEWWRRCTTLIHVPKGTQTHRLAKLADALVLDRNPGGPEPAWVAEPGPSVEYFLGAFGEGAWKPSERPFLVAVQGDNVTILTPAFEEARARLLFLPDEVRPRVRWVAWREDESPYAALVHVLGSNTKIVLDSAVRTFIADGIHTEQARHGGNAASPSPGVVAAISAIREIKDEREVGLLRCANEATLHAIRRTRARMWLGIHESKTRAILYDEMRAAGLADYSALVLFGANAALPHGSGTDRVLGKDEFALIDAGGRWGGYMADVTRTFFLDDSEIPEAHQWVWEIVRSAQRAPANFLRLIEPRDEALLSWLDDRARETVKKGMAALGVPPQRGRAPDYQVFTHRLGHGVGLQGHEAPYVVQGALGERQVRPGQVFTFEPGVYVPQDSAVGDEQVRGLGVRLEDTVVVVERGGRLGVEWLTGPVEYWGDI